jgi:polyphenol oxidase
MQKYKENEIEWLEFDLLADIPKLHHAVFLRSGGSSQGSFASLNTGFHVGDSPSEVTLNLEKIEKHLSSSIADWKGYISSRAIHGKKIYVVDVDTPNDISGFDGIMTAIPNRTLIMKHADCQIGLFYDPINHVAANVHAGWRGTVADVYAEAIQNMKNSFGTNPANILACISPSLGPDNAEFINYKNEIPEEFWHFQIRPFFFDLWSITEMQLQTAGILPHHIEIARLCTYANSHDFFSHRRDKITGRHASCITLL